MDNHLLIVNKPAMIATMGTSSDETSVLDIAKGYIGRKYNKPGSVYLGVVSRLDSLVTGALVFARTSKAAARLAEQFREHTVSKTYWALVAGRPAEQQGQLQHWLWRDDAARRTRIANRQRPETQQAKLQWTLLAADAKFSLLEIQLETGRKHQIRAQLSHIGLPILGDARYDSQQQFPSGIALHSVSLSLTHPVSKEVIAVHAPLPRSWKRWEGLWQEPCRRLQSR